MLVILEVAREMRVVGRHVEVSVPAVVEDDALAVVALRLDDRRGDGVGGLGRGDESLRPGELQRRVEHLALR